MLNQVLTGREFKLKAPTVIINYKSHEIKETDDPSTKIPVLYLTENNNLQREMLKDGILTFRFLLHAIQLASVPIHLSQEHQKLW